VVQLKQLSFVVAICRVILLQDLQFGQYKIMYINIYKVKNYQPIQHKIIYRYYLNVFIIFITKLNEHKSIEHITVIMYNLKIYLLKRLKQK